MDNPWMLGLGAGGAVLGLLKASEDSQNYRHEQNAQNIKERFSPWTHQHGEMLKKPSAMGSILQGATTGAMMGQGMGGEDAAADAVDGQSKLDGVYDDEMGKDFGSASSGSKMPGGKVKGF